MDKAALLWFEYAGVDWENARWSSKQHPQRLWGGNICFHCQQSAEKYLKGYLVGIGEQNIPRTHDLQVLRKICAKHNSFFAHPDLDRACDILSPYGVPARYPNEIEILDSDVSRALRAAKVVEQFEPIRKAFEELREAVEEAEESEGEDDLEL